MEMRPMDIEARSMEIIASELTVPILEDRKPIVMRAIHATADFSFAENLRFTDGVVRLIHGMLRDGATIVTDTHMALSGINAAATDRLGVRRVCFMAEPDIALEAQSRGVTRALVSMERALAIPGPKLIVCGNAPTFLMRLMQAMPGSDVAVIGVPVGFVNVVESKQQLWECGIPAIIAMGRRGGSNVAAAIVNALLYGALEGM